MNSELPVDIRIPSDYDSRENTSEDETGKKNRHAVWIMSLNIMKKCVQLYKAIYEYDSAGYSKRQISKMLHCSRNTVTKYLNGDYESLCRKNLRSGMEQFYNHIISELSCRHQQKGMSTVVC